MLRHVHTIEPADVGDGVYRHPMSDPRRAMLVRISFYFGGIMRSDVGVRVYEDSKGRMKMVRDQH